MKKNPKQPKLQTLFLKHLDIPKMSRFKSFKELREYFKDVDSPLVAAILLLADEVEALREYVGNVEDHLTGYED